MCSTYHHRGHRASQWRNCQKDSSMIKFELTGEILSVAASQTVQGISYVKVLPEGHWKYERQGEMPAPISIRAPSTLTKTLNINQRVAIKGKMTVGVHEWEKPKTFNQREPQMKKIENTYFTADSIDPVK